MRAKGSSREKGTRPTRSQLLPVRPVAPLDSQDSGTSLGSQVLVLALPRPAGRALLCSKNKRLGSLGNRIDQEELRLQSQTDLGSVPGSVTCHLGDHKEVLNVSFSPIRWGW